jgi:hypothetical protein
MGWRMSRSGAANRGKAGQHRQPLRVFGTLLGVLPSKGGAVTSCERTQACSFWSGGMAFCQSRSETRNYGRLNLLALPFALMEKSNFKSSLVLPEAAHRQMR